MSPRRPSERPRRPFVMMVALAIGTAANAPARAQSAAKAEAKHTDDRERAVELLKEHRSLEAMPLLEKLAKELPDDRVIQEGLVDGAGQPAARPSRMTSGRPSSSGRVRSS